MMTPAAFGRRARQKDFWITSTVCLALTYTYTGSYSTGICKAANGSMLITHVYTQLASLISNTHYAHPHSCKYTVTFIFMIVYSTAWHNYS